MIARFGLVLLALVFGVLAFTTGLLAPEALRREATNQARIAEATLQSWLVQAGGIGAARPAASASVTPPAVPADAASGPSGVPVVGPSPARARAASGTQVATPAAPLDSPALLPAAAPPTAPAASAVPPAPAASLLLAAQPVGTPSYALQAGQFSAGPAATQLAASLQARGVTSTVVAVTDQRGHAWSVVTLGRFASVEEAYAQRNYLSARLGLPAFLPALALPAAAPAPAPAPAPAR